jgi:hypothetical protein
MRKVGTEDDGSGGRPDVDGLFGRDNQWCSSEHRELSESGADPTSPADERPIGLAELHSDPRFMTAARRPILADHWYWCRKHRCAEHVGANMNPNRDPWVYCVRVGPFMSQREAQRLDGHLVAAFDPDNQPLGMVVEK